ncbi:Ubiquitin carboxyl-terminal hydrolase 7 [Geodia barretti]|nr:Ubiquitin carboxyl-terminal hydrolase 7 [Geodia barretti]
MADPPHGIQWDSRKHTGYVGLKNQGATCYMNSLLQTLYCLPKLRKAVYQMPTESDDQNKSVPLALQRLFYELQHSDKPVSTKKLTKSFGWDTMDIFMQHDIQELCRVLLDNIESKMKNTVVEGTIPGLFEGKMESYIRCTHVDYESARVETFFDIQLNIKGKKDVHASFMDYVAVETLDGENKYDAGEYALQEAKKGVIFLKLPPVLHLHLMRFQYDPIMDTNTKINDRYEFPEHLNLDRFLKKPEETPANYTLHAVLVHSGDNFGGHYVAYLNSKRDGNWLKFDDDIVSKCSARDAVDQNFGGSEDSLGIRNCTNAYMLVYARESCIDEVLQDVREEDISQELVKKFDAEKRLEQQRRKERNEAHLYMTVEIYQEDDFQAHQRADLIDFDDVKGGYIKCLKITTFPEFHQSLATMMGYPSECIRVWPFEKRSNNTTRPGYLEKLDDSKITLFQHAEQRNVWRIFVETLPADSKLECLKPYNFQQEVLLFFKYYNPTTRSISYVGHSVENIETKFRDLFPGMSKAASLHPDVPLLIFEEIKANMVEKIDPDIKIGQLDEFRDGDIICFQRADLHLERLQLPMVPDYFRELYNRIVVTFIDKNLPGDTGVTLTLNQRMTYPIMAKEVASILGTDMYHLQFFKPQGSHQDIPIRCNSEGSVREFVGTRHRYEDPYILLYQRLSIPIQEFENKKYFRCYFINDRLREEKELDLYVEKNGTVLDLLAEAYKDVETVMTSESGSRILRLVEVLGHRVVEIHSYDKPVSELHTQKMYRIEEVRKEEVELDEDEAFLPIAHFHKAPGNTFGTPFVIVVKNVSIFSLSNALSVT